MNCKRVCFLLLSCATQVLFGDSVVVLGEGEEEEHNCQIFLLINYIIKTKCSDL